MNLRPMLLSDVDCVVAIADRLAEAPRWAREVYETAVRPGSAPRRVALVAEEESAYVIGFAIASVVLPEAELETMGVAHERQRQGIGRQLLDEMSRILDGLGVTKVTLEVRASNAAAQGLYRSRGFVPGGRRPSYYIDPKEDAIIMCAYPGATGSPEADQNAARA